MPMEWEEYERGEEIKAMGEVAAANLKAILEAHGQDDVASLNRSAYKYTDCGASVGALVYRGEDNSGEWVYGQQALGELKPDDAIMALSVSSIVEGVDQETDTHVIDLFDEAFETPEMAAAAYGAALDAVEKEAASIWNESHGCPTCAAHWRENGAEGCGEGDDGVTPIWDECPDCGGSGSVI
jgi:hypothetical protein